MAMKGRNSSNVSKKQVDYKVRFVGSYYSDTKLTNSLVKQMLQHSTEQKGQKIRLRLNSEGLKLTKSLFAPRLHEPTSVALGDIAQIGIHELYKSNIICVIDKYVSRYLKIVMFRCSSSLDAMDYANVFTDIKTTSGNSKPKSLMFFTNMHENKHHSVNHEGVSTQSDDTDFRTTNYNQINISQSNKGSKKHNTENQHYLEDKSQLNDDIKSQQIILSDESSIDADYTNVMKANSSLYHVTENRPTNYSEKKIPQHLESRENKDQNVTKQELRKEIQELKDYIRQSVNLKETSTDSETPSLKINVDDGFISNSAPSSSRVKETEQTAYKFVTRHSNQNLNLNQNSHSDSLRQSVLSPKSHLERNHTNGYTIHSDSEIVTKRVERPGEARLRVDDFYRNYGPSNRYVFVPSGNVNDGLSSGTKIQRAHMPIHFTSSSTLPTRLPYGLERPQKLPPSSTKLSRTNTFSSGQTSPGLRKVTFDPKASATRYQFMGHTNDSMIKQLDNSYSYSTHSIPRLANNVMLVNGKHVRQVPENVRLVSRQHPNYILRTAESMGDLR